MAGVGLIEGFDMIRNSEAVLHKLFQKTGDKTRNCLFGLAFIVAVDGGYRAICIRKYILEIGKYDCSVLY